VFQFLKEAEAQGKKFDIVALHAVFVIQTKHQTLVSD
jgi:23S rRNA G2069 N7-methylase RlmK/C1962 C5-methylase RlmI